MRQLDLWKVIRRTKTLQFHFYLLTISIISQQRFQKCGGCLISYEINRISPSLEKKITSLQVSNHKRMSR